MFGDDTRGQLLKGTAQVVARKGVRGCTVQDVLDAASVSRRTFYKQFNSMEDALDGLFEVATAVLPATIEVAVASASSPVEQLERALDAFLNIQQLGGRLVIELHAEAIRPDSLLAERRESIISGLIAHFERAVTRSSGRELDPLIFRGLIYAAEGLVLYMHRDGEFSTEDRARVRAAVLPMILRALDVRADASLPDAPAAQPTLA
jgi:AcrR family transcriptional regulator